MFLNGRTGSEIVLRDTALSLARAGHRPVVYTRSFGAISDQLRAAYVGVTKDLASIKQPIDIIHGAHHPALTAAIAKFPTIPAVCIYQDFVHWLDAPQDLPTIRRHIAVDHALRDRLVSEGGIAPHKAMVLLNSVDLSRFRVGPKLPTRPKRAIAFAKNIEHVAPVREACEKAKLSLDVFGAAVGRVAYDVERLLSEYDLVFTSALGALEAMASGRAVIVCDGRGLAGFCDPQSYERWRPLNFGRRVLSGEPTAEAFEREIARYDSAAAEAVCQRVRADADRDAATVQLVALYREIIEENRATPVPLHETLSALGTYIEVWSPRVSREWPWMIEREELVEEGRGGRSEMSETAFDERVLAAAGQSSSRLRLLRGFSFPEDWGVWSNEADVTLAVRCPDLTTSARAVLRFMVGPVQDPEPLSLETRVKGTKRTRWAFTQADSLKTVERTIPLEGSDRSEDGLLYLHFHIEGARSPASISVSSDEREVGIGLQSVMISQGRGELQ